MNAFLFFDIFIMVKDMGKFKPIKRKEEEFDLSIDPYRSIDHALKGCKDPIDSANRMYWMTRTQMSDIDVRAKDMKNSAYNTGKFNLSHQLDVIQEKIDDLQYGTHNFDIHYLEKKESAIIDELEGLKPTAVARRTTLRVRLKNAKNRILKLKAENKAIYSKVERSIKPNPFERDDGMCDAWELLSQSDPSPRNRDSYRMRF